VPAEVTRSQISDRVHECSSDEAWQIADARQELAWWVIEKQMADDIHKKAARGQRVTAAYLMQRLRAMVSHAAVPSHRGASGTHRNG
jgi:hypothetical protein